MNITPVLIDRLKPNEIFVFGSNLSGRHGRGAAKTAMSFGAKYGQGMGIQGQCYAIPTKDAQIRKSLPAWEIEKYVDDFTAYVISNPELHFLVTRIGCGLAGYTDEEMYMLFQHLYGKDNVSLPKEWVRLIEEGD